MKLERKYDSMRGVVECLDAARILGFRDLTVTTTSTASHRTDKAFLPEVVVYHVELSVELQTRPEAVAS